MTPAQLKLGISAMILGVAGFFYGSTYATPKYLSLIEEEKAIRYEIADEIKSSSDRKQIEYLENKLENLRVSPNYLAQKNQHEEQEKSAPLNNNLAKLGLLMYAGGAYWICKEMEREDSELEKSLKGTND